MATKQGKRLPRRGHPEAKLLHALEELRRGDAQWARGRAFGVALSASAETSELCRRAAEAFHQEDGLYYSAFPSLRRLEVELVAMVSSVLGGDEQVVGDLTSDSAESILLALASARGWAAEHLPRIGRPEVILAETAHPSFLRATTLLGLEPVIVPVDQDFRADLRKVTAALSERTILIVGSAPTAPHGVIDPIGELANVAGKRGLLCHVDASLGGLVLPFLRDLGEPIPAFDLSVEGVSSLNVDLSGYGGAPPGASIILYREPLLRRAAAFSTAGWPGGVYAATTLSSSRPGATVAAAWAVMNWRGAEGYRDNARALMESTRALRRGIEAIEGLSVLGEPAMSILAFTSDRHDLNELADHLGARGWLLERQHSPASLNLTVTTAQRDQVEAFLRDLAEAAHSTRQEPIERLLGRTRDILAEAASKVLPRRLMKRVSSLATSRLHIPPEVLRPAGLPLRGKLPRLEADNDPEAAALDALERLTRENPELVEILPEPIEED